MRHILAAILVASAPYARSATLSTTATMSPSFDTLDAQTHPDRILVTQIYPYVVPKEYLAHADATAPIESLGHDVYVTLVVDVGGLVRGLSAQDLTALGLDWPKARSQAMLNLAALANRQAISMQVFPKGPGDLPFILAGGHWAAATLILSPKLPKIAADKLATRDVCASIPHREALLLFPCGTPESRRAMRALIRQNESNGSKPLTFGLFALKATGIQPIADD